MSIRHLRTLVAIAEQGTFACAADAVALTQSAVSVQMKTLEEELGVELFDRSKRPPILNDFGRALIPQAREIVARYEGLREQARGTVSLHGHLKLGSIGSTLTGFLPRVLAGLRKCYPGLHVDVTSGFSSELIAQVDRGVLDLAIVSELHKVPKGLRWQSFLRDPLVLIAPKTATETNPQRLVEQYPFIRFTPRAAVGEAIDATIRSARLNIREHMRLDWIDAIEAMVSSGLGVAIVPERKYRQHSTPELKIVPIGPPTRFRTLGIVESASNKKNELSKLFFEQLKAATQ